MYMWLRVLVTNLTDQIATHIRLYIATHIRLYIATHIRLYIATHKRLYTVTTTLALRKVSICQAKFCSPCTQQIQSLYLLGTSSAAAHSG